MLATGLAVCACLQGRRVRFTTLAGLANELTNLPFGEWTKVFPDPRLAKAVVDRLTHRAHIIDTGNESGASATASRGRGPR